MNINTESGSQTHLFVFLTDLNSDVYNNENVNHNLSCEKSDHVCHILRDLRVKNTNRIAIESLNINSIVNKFDALKIIIPGDNDIFDLTETKLDVFFQAVQFCIEGLSTPYRLYRDRNGGAFLSMQGEIYPPGF